ncbi:hypothetical protein KEJ39_03460 [Candidatus Bathyarchaeota archaeon]|nr:hypothetical protein [Candidatus Bathyarchaeota archaeon]
MEVDKRRRVDPALTKKQIGARVSTRILEGFNEIRRKEGLSLGEAVQALMETANDLGSIKHVRAAAESGRDRLQQKIRLALEAEINRFEAYYEDDRRDPPEETLGWKVRAGEARRMMEKIIDLVGEVTDPELTRKAHDLVVEASRFYGAH